MRGIVLIAGLPASGKTTLANALLDCAPPHISVKKWTLDEMPNVGRLKDKNDCLFKQLTQDTLTDIHIIDDTFHLQSMRKRYLLHCRQNGQGFVIIILLEGLNVLLKRNAARTESVTDQEIVKMGFTFDYDDHPLYRLDYDPSVQILWTRLLSKLEETSALHIKTLSVPPSVPTDHSPLHFLNILLNRAVGYLVKGSLSQEHVAVQMGRVKSEILKDKKINGLSPTDIEALGRMDQMHFVPLLKKKLSERKLMCKLCDDAYK